MEPDSTLVRALLREQLPHLAHLPVRPVPRQGNDNRTFRVGEELAVRLPSGPSYAAAVGVEDRVLPLVAAHVTVAVPEVVATGAPGRVLGLPWSLRRWLPGTVVDAQARLDHVGLAQDLGRFLTELRAAPAADAPACGRRTFFRGCHPSVYGDEVRSALERLGDRVDQAACRRTWDAAVVSAWPRPPVWVHGDLAGGNLLVRDGRLSAVIDVGCCGAGDPACDLVVAWTVLDDRGRAVLHETAGLDDDTWARARGWALWKALVSLADPRGARDPVQRRALDRLLRGSGPPQVRSRPTSSRA